MIFSDTLLNQLQTDAENQIIIDVPCIYHKFYLATQAGVSVYSLPGFTKGIQRITWRGRKLDEMSWEEMTLLTPSTDFVSAGSPYNSEAQSGDPLYYSLHPTNIRDIRLYPAPTVAFSDDPNSDPYSPLVEDRCIVTCWRSPDTSNLSTSVPTYIDRRTRKSYILGKAFEVEGKGQSMKFSQYYLSKYETQIEMFRKINDGSFIGKRYSLEDGVMTSEGFRYPKPVLNPNFERIFFR